MSDSEEASDAENNMNTMFLSAVSEANERCKEQGTGDVKFQMVYSLEEETKDKEDGGEVLCEEMLCIGGNPFFYVYDLPRTHEDPVEALGFARAVQGEGGYGAGEIDDLHINITSPPSAASWEKFAAVREYFTDKKRLARSNLEDVETYATFIGILEPPVAVLVTTAWGNGCKFQCLLLTDSHIYAIRYSNG